MATRCQLHLSNPRTTGCWDLISMCSFNELWHLSLTIRRLSMGEANMLMYARRVPTVVFEVLCLFSMLWVWEHDRLWSGTMWHQVVTWISRSTELRLRRQLQLDSLIPCFFRIMSPVEPSGTTSVQSWTSSTRATLAPTQFQHWKNSSCDNVPLFWSSFSIIGLLVPSSSFQLLVVAYMLSSNGTKNRPGI